MGPLRKTLLSSMHFPLGVCPVPGDAADPSALSLQPRTLAGLHLLHCCSHALQQGRGMRPGLLTGTWHTPRLSQGRTVHLPACKEREKKKCICFTAVYATEPHVMVFQGREAAASHHHSPEHQWAWTDPEAVLLPKSRSRRQASDCSAIAQPWPFPDYRQVCLGTSLLGVNFILNTGFLSHGRWLCGERLAPGGRAGTYKLENFPSPS